VKNNVFLETVVPTQGVFCAVAIDDKTKQIRRHIFVDSHAELDEAATKLNNAGFGTFVALASFNEERNRKAENALFLRSVFVDLDVGETKPYADPALAANALRTFVDENNLPDPLIVISGGGVHAYWPFTEDIPVDQWRPVARAFKRMCLERKLGIDTAVTADAARILRMPGTNNYKLDNPRPCQIATMGAGPIDFEAFKALIPNAAEIDLTAARAFGTDDLTRSLSGGNLPKAKFIRIAKLSLAGTGCAQIRSAIENAESLEEPAWRAALSIAWNCVDAEKAIHKLSAAHPDYTPEDTLEKAQRLTGKPYTCAWYRDNYPSGCAECKHRITSPIQLGAFVEESKPNADGVYVVETALNPDNEESVTTVEVGIPEYPYPYFRGANGGVYRKQKDGDGNEIPPAVIYEQDLYITNRFFDSDDKGDGEGELVGLNLHLPHDGIRRFHAPVVALLTKDKLRDTLVKQGVIAYGKQLDSIMGYLAASVRKLQSNMASNRTRSQLGWTDENSFVVGEMEYTATGIKLAPPASGIRQFAPAFHSRGTLEEWRKVVDFYNIAGMEGHAFALFAGLGSNLLQLLNNPQVRGAVINLVSNGSGTGKTTVQLAINSLFGNPTLLLMEAKDSPASRFHRLGMLNSICMTVDELTNANGEQLSALVYGSTSGRGAHRMEASSNKLRANNTTWCSFTITSSNAVMADALASHRMAVEGELKRVIDLHISLPVDIPKQVSDELFVKLADNYGLAGPIFIQYVINHREEVEKMLRDMQIKVDAELGMERSDRFYSAVLACAFTAGAIAKQLGLWDIDIKRVYDWAVRAFKDVKQSNAETIGSSSTPLALEVLGRYLNENVNRMLIINGAKTAEITAPLNRNPVQGPLKLRYEPDTDELSIPVTDLRQYFSTHRVDVRASIKDFADQGALVLAPDGSTSLTRRLGAGAMGGMSVPPMRCYVFKPAKLGMAMDIEIVENGTST
jgi:hypothetical protein